MLKFRPRFASFALLLLLAHTCDVCFAGPLQRVANTTLAMPASPPVFGYASTNAFPGLVFTNPICITSPPGETNRLFIVGKNGVITVITNLAAPNETTFLDLTARVTSTTANSGTSGEQGLLSLAFHPGYATNRYCYVFYTGNATTAQTGRHDILSRFQISALNTNQADPNSETYIFAQYDRDPNHNAGDVHFGTDGYLYVSVGDEGAEHDGRTNAQVIVSNLFAGMLRIDVDKRPGNLAPNPSPTLATTTNYLVPADNPYIGITSFNGLPVNSNQVRTEFWAVGLRNPWRWSFDPLNGVLYCGDVGQDHYEEVDVITKGANYGWAYWEGTNIASGGTLPHMQPINPTFPIVAYDHGTAQNQGNCVIGGVVYRGQRLSQLYGSYVFADYVDGNIWAITASNYLTSPAGAGGTIGPPTPIISDSSLFITAFGVDPSNGDVLHTATKTSGYATNASINRITYNSTTNGAPIPPTLADTGAFTNLAALTSPNDALAPAAGIVPYDINLPFWSDNAIKTRWFSVPSPASTITFNSNGNWSFPTGTVWIKHFNLQLTNGDPTSIIRLETRLLVKNASGIYGVTYRWGGSQTNATLVADAGMDESFLIDDGGGNVRTQVWHYPSRNECITCHTPAGGFGLGFRTEQLNRDFAYPNGTTNEITALSDAGYFSAGVSSVNTLGVLAAPTNTAIPLEFRARSFLAANCSQCHQPGGSAQAALWDARITTPTALAGLINGTLVNNLGDPANYVIAPLSLSNSVLLSRISTRGAGSIQMPPLDSNLADTQAVALVSMWIGSLTNTFWLAATPASQTAASGGAAVAYSITNLATGDFTSSVSLSVSGLPAGTGAVFSPASITGSGSSTMTVTAAGNTPVGTYALTVTGVGGGLTNTAAATLVVNSGVVALPGTLLWTSTGDWSVAPNWTNVTAGGFGPPGISNGLVFTNIGTASASALTSPGSGVVIPANINSSVSGSFAIIALTNLANAPNTSPVYHNLGLAAGATLTAGNVQVGGFGAYDFGANNVVNMTISGAGAALVVTNGGLTVSQGSGSSGAHDALLDLSGLDNFTMTGTQIRLGVENVTRAGGILYLARTNTLTLLTAGYVNSDGSGSPYSGNPALYLGHNKSAVGNGAQMYLGISNSVAVDYVTVGRGDANTLLAFNPAFFGSAPSVYISGTNGGASRVGVYVVGDNSAGEGGSVSDTNDFTGGTVSALVNYLCVGRGREGASDTTTCSGYLTFNTGSINANALAIGFLYPNGSNSFANGTVNVNGGTLTVMTNVTLASRPATGGTGATQGTLNINGGTVQAGGITSGGGVAVINMNGGSLTVTNAVAAPSRALSSCGLTNATLGFQVNGGSPATNLCTTNLTISGINLIKLGAVTNISGTVTVPLISYATLNGSVAASFTLAPAPGYTVSLVDDSAHKLVSARLIASAPAAPQFTSITLSGTSLAFGGTNGAPSGNYYVLTSTNATTPVSNWTVLATNSFDSSGNFAATNTLPSNSFQQYFLLRLP